MLTFSHKTKNLIIPEGIERNTNFCACSVHLLCSGQGATGSFSTLFQHNN